MATPQHDHTTRPQHITPLYFTTFLHVVGNPAVYRPVWLMDYYTPSLLLQQLGAVKLSQTSHPWQKEEGTLSLVTSLWKCSLIHVRLSQESTISKTIPAFQVVHHFPSQFDIGRKAATFFVIRLGQSSVYSQYRWMYPKWSHFFQMALQISKEVRFFNFHA